MNVKKSSKPSEPSLKKTTEAAPKAARPYPTVEEYLAGIKKLEKVHIPGYKQYL